MQITSIVVLILCVGCLSYECEQGCRRVYPSTHFSGLLDTTYLDLLNRGTPTLILQTGEHHSTHTYSLIWYVRKGDSISKSHNSLKYSVYRNGKQRVFWPECGKIEILDGDSTRNLTTTTCN